MAQEEHASYLKRLKFDPKLFSSFAARYLNNPRLLILILIAIIGAGIFSFINLPRRLNPQIDIPIVIVNTVLPGAAPQDVESLVTIPIEDALNGLAGVTKMSSTSRDSVSTITLEFESGIDPEKARTDVHAITEGVTDLPDDATDPVVQKLDFENQPIWQFAITSKSDYASLDRFARILRDRLEEKKLIDRVTVNGLEESEIQILIKPEAVSTYKLNTFQITQAISASINSFPAGSVRTETSTFSLTVDKSVLSVDDLRKIRVNLSGTVVSLGDISTISEKSKPDQRQSFIATNEDPTIPAITFDVYKTSNADITKAYEEAHEEADLVLNQYHNQFEVLNILNTAELIADQFNELLRDFTITVGLVFLVLLIFLGSRQAIVSTLSVPLTFLITFTVMQITGIELSFLAYFSLLLSLGLLVDDTIVVISAMTAYHRSGKFTPIQTGLLVWRDFIVPIFTTTITTIWAFIPLLLASGIIGEFIKPIPIVVSTTLLASFVIAMFITLPIIVFLLKPVLPKRLSILLRLLIFLGIVGAFVALLPKSPILLIQVLVFLILLRVIILTKSQLLTFVNKLFKFEKPTKNNKFAQRLEHGFINFERVSNNYQRLIKRIVSSKRSRVLTLVFVIIFSVFSYILVPAGFVKNEFFPSTDEDYIYVSLELPAGTNLNISKTEALEITEKLRDTRDLKYVTTNIGLAFDPNMGGTGGGESNNILFTLTLNDEREETSGKIAQDLREEFKDYQKGTLSVVEVSGGPPAGADVQVKLIGDDLATLDQLGTKVEDYLKTQSGVSNVNKSIKSGTSKLTFVPDQDKLAQNNLSLMEVGGSLRLFASGQTADSVKLSGEKEVDINIRTSDSSQYAENINSIQVPTQAGVSVPLMSLGSLKLNPNPTLITREDGQRTLSVAASVAAGSSIPEANQKLINYVQNDLKLPQGYTWATGGANEENEKSVQSIIAAMGLSFLLIILTMVVQFSSFRKALIVMLVIPLSISGVFIIFALSHTPLSFPALIGVLALFGIVVKNSILLVDKISKNVETGMEFKEAIAEGSASRLEAITLTSIGTIFGLIPITLSDPLWRGLGGAIIAGLTFSGTIMVFFIPVVYYYWFRTSIKSSRR